MAADGVFRVGENVMFTVSNRPWLDMSVPIESNDYMPVQSAVIKIYGPCDELLMEDYMCEMIGKIGWYYYNYQTTALCNKPGLHRVVIELGCEFPSCGGMTVCTTGSSGVGTSGTSGVGTSGTSGVGTSGTSGMPDSDLITSVKVGSFRLLSLTGVQ